jgi:ATP-dependent DNA ligase
MGRFRCLIFRDGAAIELQSKSGQSLTRYFPELVATVASLKAKRFVLDGEIVVPNGRGFSFDDLLQRIHPAASRVKRLAGETSALLIVFDLLIADDGQSLVRTPLGGRRKLLEAFARKHLRGQKTLRLSPATTKIAVARKWFKQVGANLDGIIAKRRDLPYESGNRHGMQKIKNYRSADCVVGGFRYNEGKRTVGSLLLGLYDEQGLLNHVGFTSSLKSGEKKALTAKLEKLVAPPSFTGDKPGGPSRWSTKRSAEWKPLRPKLVVEICDDHFSGGRFRHGTKLMRWRPDKAPRQCTMDQVRQKKADLMKLLK